MPRIDKTHRSPTRALAALTLLLACLGLAACGGSSSTTTASTAAASTTASSSASGGTSGASGATGARSGRFAALRDCLQQHGITLPKRTPGQGRPPGSGGFLGGSGGAALPNGVTRGQFEAAMKACGGGSFGGGRARFNSPQFKQALTKFAACMRENGVNVPTPNTSGSGPIFSTKGLNVNGAQFKNAEQKCRPDLAAAGLRRGAPGGGPPTGAPPGSGEASAG